MQVVCVQAFGDHKPGDLAEVPDGAEVSAVYYEPVAAPEAEESPPPQTGPGTIPGPDSIQPASSPASSGPAEGGA